jgi:ATP-dependent Clp protease ATP-binding subunit ClpC
MPEQADHSTKPAVLQPTPGAQLLIDAASARVENAGPLELHVNHWLLTLVEMFGPMAESISKSLDAAAIGKHVASELNQGNLGPEFSLATILDQAGENAKRRGKTQIGERDLATVILAAAGYAVSATSDVVGDQSVHSVRCNNAGANERDVQNSPLQRRPTPTLDQFGRDLTQEAAVGKLKKLVSRDEELDLVVETLCRTTKRNPVLVGPAGVGKTAVMEGLAQRIIDGQVPPLLRGARLLAIQPSTLVAGSHMSGELEKRVQAVIDEASQDGILLFVDELHSMIGAGGMPGAADVGSLLKPALARGQVACIGATTDDEYRRFIEPDKALERRFQPIRVQELTADQTLQVLVSLSEGFAQSRGVQVTDETLAFLVDFSQRYLRNRYFPDKAIDLLEQCVAHGLAHGTLHIDRALANLVCERLVGMPVTVQSGLIAVRQHLVESMLLPPNDLEKLVNRLEITQRNLDTRSVRPNAVVLLIDHLAHQADLLAAAIAGSLFSSPTRVVTIDFSRFAQATDVTALVGAPPGYVGYSDSLPLHQVAQTPWCVLLCKSVDCCHPVVRLLLQQAISDGYFTDGRGKRIYICDLIVLLTANIGVDSKAALGFQHGIARHVADDAWTAATRHLGSEFLGDVDMVLAGSADDEAGLRLWLHDVLFKAVTARYLKHSLEICWDDSVLELIMGKSNEHDTRHNWERFVDEHIAPLLIPHLPEPDQKEVCAVTVSAAGGAIRVDRQFTQKGDH